ncbi:hypothetical protein KY343_03610 [Candidatus Woesearchaeota archaeon]|nr:hypothetical protein [Candidatus Woesearchaeota archaeon]
MTDIKHKIIISEEDGDRIHFLIREKFGYLERDLYLDLWIHKEHGGISISIDKDEDLAQDKAHFFLPKNIIEKLKKELAFFGL